jgi:hypothetical protein
MELRSVQGTANPSSLFAIATQINGGGYTDRLTLTNAGNAVINAASGIILDCQFGGVSALQVTQTALNFIGYGQLASFKNNSDASNSYLLIQNTTIAVSFGVQDAASAYFYTNGNFILSAGATERMRVQASGGVSIGVATDPGIGNLLVNGTMKASAIVGTATNTSRAAGQVGETIESDIPSASAVALTTNTTANVTSVALTAGNWIIFGQVAFVEASGTITVANPVKGGSSATSASIEQTNCFAVLATTSAANDTFVNAIPDRRVSLSGSATYYLVAFATFTGTSVKAYGRITALRTD